jgi:3-deoxy-D-manno-octulosonic-acid transferase
MIRRIREYTPDVRKWSDQVEARVTVVDRQGFLVESYARAQWAYVGGGFGRGLHSVLEPAFFRVPIACGPKGLSRFPEAKNLRDQGQLHVVSSAQEFKDFLERATAIQSDGAARWSTWIDEQFGATERATMLLCPK